MIPDLTAGRATAETTLTDECVITRADRGTARTVNPTTLAITGGPDITVWSGPCSASPSGVGNTATTSGATQGRLDTYKVRVPVTAVGIENGDAVTFTAIGPRGDPDLLDCTLVVESVDRRTTTVLRRLTCVRPGPADGVPT